MFKRSLGQRSSEALELFSKAISSLKEVNEEISLKKSSLRSDVLVIEKEIDELSLINNNNSKVISNIENMLS
jgi:hypothetical protein